MPQTKARGQISFVDLNDGKSFMFTLGSNRPLTQKHLEGTTTYYPNYASDNLVITPLLSVSGLSGNRFSKIVGTPTWTVNGAAISTFADGVSAANVAPFALTISKNQLVNSDFMTIGCSVIYEDQETHIRTNLSTEISFTIIAVQDKKISAEIEGLGDIIFYNDDEGNQVVKLHAYMMRGLSEDYTNVDYAWFRKDNPAGADVYDWHKIVSAYTGEGGAPATGTLDDGQSWIEVLKGGLVIDNASAEVAGGSVLSIHSADIVNYDSFMCVCTDTDNAADNQTYNESVRTAVISVLDHSDNYAVDVTSDTGNFLPSGTQSANAVAHLKRGGSELSDSIQNSFYYLWTKMNKNGRVATGQDLTSADDFKAADNNGTPDSNWSVQTVGGVSGYCRYGTGAAARAITVYKNEIDLRNTFAVEVIVP